MTTSEDVPDRTGGRDPASEPDAEPLAARLRRHIQRLAGEIGERNVLRSQALAAAGDYIADEWTRQGYVVRRQWFEADGVRCANLEVARAGGVRPRQILLLGAHYDSVPGSPGANDNASGVAALLDIARRFTTLSPEITVRFVAFANEEPPFYATPRQGSMIYASASRAVREDIRLMVSLETIGCYRDDPGSQLYPPPLGLFYPQRGNFLAFVSDLGSALWMRRCARAFRSSSRFPLACAAVPRWIPGVSWSDHYSFWQHGYHAFMVTDTAFHRYRHYHTAKDTPEKLSYGQFAAAVDGLGETFAIVSGARPQETA